MSASVLEGGLCALHQQPSRGGVCERCGAFLCEACPPGRRCAPCQTRFDYTEGEGRHRVVAPGLTLAALGGLSLLLSPLIIFYTLSAGWPELQGDRRYTPEGLIILGTMLLPVPASLVVTAGGIQLARCRGYWLAVAGAVVSVVPFISTCWFLSVFGGIWALVVLRRPDVRAAFAAQRQQG